jgi:hypothetical protein
MSVFDENQIRQAIEKYQRAHHPIDYAVDVSHINSEDSLNMIKSEVEKLVEKMQKDADMYIICEMAKQYLNGAKPTVGKKTIVPAILHHPKIGEVHGWHDRQRELLYLDYISLEAVNELGWKWEEVDE